MKKYAIYDEEINRPHPIGYLFYYEKAESFIIELCEDLDEWEAPILFQRLVRQRIYTVSREISLMWVKERIIPSGRQNIGSIIRNHKLSRYNEMDMLWLSKGRCSQDKCYIAEVEKIPEYILQRMRNNVSECVPMEDYRILCMFKDASVRVVELQKLVNKYKEVKYILRNKELFYSVKVGIGGYSVTFNESIEISCEDLRTVGRLLPLTINDMYGFIRRNVIDTTEACNMLQCSRQNLFYLVKSGKLIPIINGSKENMYLKGEIERFMNE